MGSNWSLATLARDRGASDDQVATWLAQSRARAELLGTSLADLPPRPAGDDAPPANVEYLFAEGQRLGRELATRHGPDHAALLELALKSNLLLVLYEPERRIAETAATAITDAAERAQLPPELWKPLVSTLADQLSDAAVQQAVFRLHDDMDQFLAGTSQSTRGRQVSR